MKKRVMGIVFVGVGILLLGPLVLVISGTAAISVVAVIGCTLLGLGLIGVGIFGNDRIKYWASNLIP